MDQEASHGHSHGLGDIHVATGPMGALSVALAVTGTVFLVELIGGLLSGSLALVSDAMHMLSDSAGLIIALLAALIGRRAATARATYGHRRVEVFAALINAITVSAVVVWILIQAFARLGGEHEIDTGLMLIIAVIGLLANAISAWVLSRQQEESLNVQGAFLHVMADLIGSVVVIIAALVIRWTGWTPADTLASLVIVALVLPRSLRLLWQSSEVLLERVPHGVDTERVAESLSALPGVAAVHDLHVWSTDGMTPLATCHLVIDRDQGIGAGILDLAQAQLREFGIEHSTIQLEYPEHLGHEQIC
ncbi:cation diffusion facilitator family transporter [Corynebacterium alimapuense]|uniref:Cation transporter n=1 Tax=Corynebacterium alimapuense TaxID=1576874 RepID=A0A3M8K6D3_9CORY|nr:cation diffusion facilitator family transporter [Corynebacterium alimapuense]RNE48142.1 cation transporter [Corynebacterium alimapuense]